MRLYIWTVEFNIKKTPWLLRVHLFNIVRPTDVDNLHIFDIFVGKLSFKLSHNCVVTFCH